MSCHFRIELKRFLPVRIATIGSIFSVKFAEKCSSSVFVERLRAAKGVQ